MKRFLIKLAFNVVSQLIIDWSIKKKPHLTDELISLVNEIREHELK